MLTAKPLMREMMRVPFSLIKGSLVIFSILNVSPELAGIKRLTMTATRTPMAIAAAMSKASILMFLVAAGTSFTGVLLAIS